MSYDQVQFAPVFQTPVIADDYFDPSAFVGEHFQSMAGYDKNLTGDMFEFHDATTFAPYLPSTYAPQMYSHDARANIANHGYEYYNENDFSTAQQNTPDKFIPVDFTPRPTPQLNAFHIEQPPKSRKRKASEDVEVPIAPVPKKLMLTQVKIQDVPGEYYDLSGHTSPYSPYVTTPAATVPLPVNLSARVSPRPMGHHHSISTASQASIVAPSPHTPLWSPSFTTVKSEHSPRPPMTPVARPASTSSPVKSVPKLVRTSTIQSPMGLSSSMGAVNPGFNPYAMYPSKACLKLKGDLDGMVKDWTAEEVDARRRLVEFTRSQSGSTINAEFKPVTLKDRASTGITISCILWKEKKDYFVTSVDTIYLLESLVGVRFTVEEKNRIRRNLEGFRPMTVSKSKLDSEDFFKTIMGFPHPKPRNIEKDVKIFPWKILSHALKKIISKYSASYSSTASALMTASQPTFIHTEAAIEYPYSASPPLEMTPATIAPFAVGSPVYYQSGPIAGRMSAPVTTAPVQHLPLQMPTAGPQYGIDNPYEFQSFQPGHVSLPVGAQMMTISPNHLLPSWEFTGYESNPAMPAHSAPLPTYSHDGVETSEFILPIDYANK